MRPSLQSAPPEPLRAAFQLHQAGRFPEAISMYGALHSHFPRDPQLLFLFGTALLQSGRAEDGLGLLQSALEWVPDQPAVLLNLGLGLKELGRLAAALEQLDRAVSIQPDFAEAHYNRGSVLQLLARAPEALASYEKAISLSPGLAAAHQGRANVLREGGRPEEALNSYQTAISLAPEFADAWYNRGLALQDLQRLDEALVSFERAIALAPELPDAHNHKGIVLRMLGRVHEACESYDRAIALKHDMVEAYVNRGIALQSLLKVDEATADYDRALALRPDSADALWNKALLRLLKGDFETGWRLYESRFAAKPARNCSQPSWRAETSLAGKTILVFAEQGLGDVIQFCRYVPILVRMGARVVMEIPATLVRLLSTLDAGVELISAGDPLPAFDIQCPLMSLPLALSTTLANIPAEIPYLRANAAEAATVRAKLGPGDRPRVGLVWSGRSAHLNDRNRSIPLERFRPILEVPCEFHSLQVEYRAADLAALPHLPQIVRHDTELKDFADTAALMSAMDLVICIDTSVAHLAGALGKPVWILLPFAPDFRWLLDRTDSPWYPTATLYRQAAPGDWAGVLRRVSEDLQRTFR